MKHLMGLLKPDAGHIWVDGEDIVPLGDVEMAHMRRKFGMVFQYAALFDSMNVVENIAFPLLERYRLSRDEVMERVRDLLKRLDLADVAGIEQKFPAELSGGQRKRVGLARALIDRPEILLYDEPTTGLDPVATKNVDEMIRRTADEFGVTSVVISHDMASTFRIGDRISMLYAGQDPRHRHARRGAGLEAARAARVRRDLGRGGDAPRAEGASHEAKLGGRYRWSAGDRRVPGELFHHPLDQRAGRQLRGLRGLGAVPRRLRAVREVARADRRASPSARSTSARWIR